MILYVDFAVVLAKSSYEFYTRQALSEYSHVYRCDSNLLFYTIGSCLTGLSRLECATIVIMNQQSEDNT